MSTLDELRRHFAYNRWATLRILDAAASLTTEELTRDLKSSFPSVLATLAHGLGAERVWLTRWRGTSPTEFPPESSLASLAEVRAAWDALWRDQQAYLSELRESDADLPLSFKTFKGDPDTRPLGDLMRHVINHATYHRGQVVTMLRQLGKTPPSTDYIRFLREGG
jgi:uncharacterized damage-inducible protein DinB